MDISSNIKTTRKEPCDDFGTLAPLFAEIASEKNSLTDIRGLCCKNRQ